MLCNMWHRVLRAVGYIDSLLAQTRTAEFNSDEKRHLSGLLPPSISHEGYSDKPAYSYWDDFWALAGYDGAVAIAQALGHDADAERFAGERKEFGGDLHASLRASIAGHHIDYIPGSADRGDFDPTSTTIALSVAHRQA